MLCHPLFATKAAVHCAVCSDAVANNVFHWRLLLLKLCLIFIFTNKCRARERFAAGTNSLVGIKKQTLVLFCIGDGHFQGFSFIVTAKIK
jgi:hypothetical protein